MSGRGINEGVDVYTLAQTVENIISQEKKGSKI